MPCGFKSWSHDSSITGCLRSLTEAGRSTWSQKPSSEDRNRQQRILAGNSAVPRQSSPTQHQGNGFVLITCPSPGSSCMLSPETSHRAPQTTKIAPLKWCSQSWSWGRQASAVSNTCSQPSSHMLLAFNLKTKASHTEYRSHVLCVHETVVHLSQVHSQQVSYYFLSTNVSFLEPREAQISGLSLISSTCSLAVWTLHSNE